MIHILQTPTRTLTNFISLPIIIIQIQQDRNTVVLAVRMFLTCQSLVSTIVSEIKFMWEGSIPSLFCLCLVWVQSTNKHLVKNSVMTPMTIFGLLILLLEFFERSGNSWNEVIIVEIMSQWKHWWGKYLISQSIDNMKVCFQRLEFSWGEITQWKNRQVLQGSPKVFKP